MPGKHFTTDSTYDEATDDENDLHIGANGECCYRDCDDLAELIVTFTDGTEFAYCPDHEMWAKTHPDENMEVLCTEPL